MKLITCFIHPPNSHKKVIHDYAGGLGFEADSGYFLPSIDMLQIATCLEQDDFFSIDYIDANAQYLAEEDVLNYFRAKGFDIVIVQVSIPTIQNDIAFIKKIVNYATKIVVRIRTENKEILSKILENKEITLCLIGECEDSISEILLGNQKIGSAFLTNDGVEIHPKQFIKSLDILPMLNRNLIKNIQYNYPKLGICATLLTSRGCPYSCGYYCPYPLTQGKKVRFRSVNLVVAEIKQIIELGIDKILFRDPVFTINKVRVMELCNEIVKQNISISWWCETRADLLDRELLEAMKFAGCIGINVGVESGDENLRFSHLKRGLSDEILVEICKDCKALEIQIAFLLMVGFPGETKESILKTALLIEKCRPDSIGISFPVPYPDTLLEREAHERKWIFSDNLIVGDGSIPIIQTKELTHNDMVFAKDILNTYFENLNTDNNYSYTVLKSISEWANSKTA